MTRTGPFDRRGFLAAAAGLAVGLAGCGAGPGAAPGIYLLRLSTGELSRVAEDAARPAWSPDGRSLAWCSGSGLWRGTADGGDRARLLQARNASPPAFSPDGRRVAVTDPDRHALRIVDIDGRNPIEIAVGQAGHLGGVAPVARRNVPAWSPDGRTILAAGWDGHGDAVYRIDVASGTAEEISNARLSTTPFHGGEGDNPARAAVNAVWPAWSPDGNMAAWATLPQVAQATGGLYVVEVTGGAPRRLAEAVPSFGPLWSPDGKRLLAVAATSGGPGLVRVEAEAETNGRDMSMFPLPAGSRPVDAAWAPDGAAIAWSDGASIRLFTLASQSHRELPGTPLADLSPAWSPDGERLA
ncbi:MAG: TolB family protein, partial [Chloroflexota bacterium]